MLKAQKLKRALDFSRMTANSSSNVRHERFLFSPSLTDRNPDTGGVGSDVWEEDQYLKNGMIVSYGSDGDFIVSRPGFLRENRIISATSNCEGRGVFYWDVTDSVYAVADSTIFKDGSALTGNLETSSGPVFWEAWLGNNGLLVFQDKERIYTIDQSDNVVCVNAPAWQASTAYVAGDFVTNDTDKVYICTTGGTSAGSGGPTGTGSGISDNTVVWDYAQTVTGGSNIPTAMVAGLVGINQYMFVADSTGNIYNSNNTDIYSWSSADIVKAELLPDNLVQISRHVNYLAAFGTKGVEFFYDAANPNGSPLSRLQGTFLYVGAFDGGAAGNAAHVVNIDDIVMWISSNQVGTLNVTQLKGFEHKHVGTPSVISLLNLEKSNRAMWEAYYYNMRGKRLYVISIATANKSNTGNCVVYDIDSERWYSWKYGDGGDIDVDSWPMRGSTSESDAAESRGKMFVVNRVPMDTQQEEIWVQSSYDSLITDIVEAADLQVGDPIDLELQTRIWDAGNNKNKFVHRVGVIGNLSANVVQISWQDEDEQTSGQDDPTFSTARSLTYSSNTSRGLWRCGSCQRRRFKLNTTSVSDGSRLQGLDIYYTEGTYGGI